MLLAIVCLTWLSTQTVAKKGGKAKRRRYEQKFDVASNQSALVSGSSAEASQAGDDVNALAVAALASLTERFDAVHAGLDALRSRLDGMESRAQLHMAAHRMGILHEHGARMSLAVTDLAVSHLAALGVRLTDPLDGGSGSGSSSGGSAGGGDAASFLTGKSRGKRRQTAETLRRLGAALAQVRRGLVADHVTLAADAAAVLDALPPAAAAAAGAGSAAGEHPSERGLVGGVDDASGSHSGSAGASSLWYGSSTRASALASLGLPASLSTEPALQRLVYWHKAFIKRAQSPESSSGEQADGEIYPHVRRGSQEERSVLMRAGMGPATIDVSALTE